MKTQPPSPVITSTANPRIVAARKLKQRKHREAEARFLVEGLQLMHMALDGGVAPDQVFFCPEQFTGTQGEHLLQRFRERGSELLQVAPHVMAALSERDEPQGIVATFHLVRPTLAALKLASHELVVVVDRLQDPGNLGTLIRTADAVAAAAVVLVEPCVDPYDFKTIRGSMGSLFNLPVIGERDVAGLFEMLKRAGLRVVGADPHLGITWGEGLWMGGVALVLGNEARGLSADVAAHVDAWARLPIVGKAESLNVAVAGGVLMYAWLRENRF